MQACQVGLAHLQGVICSPGQERVVVLRERQTGDLTVLSMRSMQHLCHIHSISLQVLRHQVQCMHPERPLRDKIL